MHATRRTLLLFVLASLSAPSLSASPLRSVAPLGDPFAAPATDSPLYAQRLVDTIIAKNPDLLDVIFHVTRPNEAQNYAVAAHTAHELGAKSGDDDLGVAATGKPLVEVQKDGVRIGVVVQLHDKHGKSIGALGVMYPYHAGDKESDFLARSEAIRDQLARKIPSVEALFKQKKH